MYCPHVEGNGLYWFVSKFLESWAIKLDKWMPTKNHYQKIHERISSLYHNSRHRVPETDICKMDDGDVLVCLDK